MVVDMAAEAGFTAVVAAGSTEAEAPAAAGCAAGAASVEAALIAAAVEVTEAVPVRTAAPAHLAARGLTEAHVHFPAGPTQAGLAHRPAGDSPVLIGRSRTLRTQLLTAIGIRLGTQAAQDVRPQERAGRLPVALALATRSLMAVGTRLAAPVPAVAT
jgi:hypothetical protein